MICVFENIVNPHYCYEARVLVLIVPVPGYCLYFTFQIE